MVRLNYVKQPIIERRMILPIHPDSISNALEWTVSVMLGQNVLEKSPACEKSWLANDDS
jgi:hypothetical protein